MIWDPIVITGPHYYHGTPLLSWDPIIIMGPHYSHGTPLFSWDPITRTEPDYKSVYASMLLCIFPEPTQRRNLFFLNNKNK